MKALKNLSLLLLLVLAFTGCHNKSSKLADFNRTVYTPEYASGFNIERCRRQKERVGFRHETVAGRGQRHYEPVHSRDGEAVPAEFRPVRCSREMPSASSAMSSTHIAMLDAIGETARVVGVLASTTSPIPTFRHGGSSIGDVGYEGNINYETSVLARP